MELTPSQKETARHEFDRLCKMVLRGEAIDYDNHIAWRSKHEASFSWLSESQERQLGVLDEYPCERFCFQVQGYTIPIRSEILANALVKLSEKKRDAGLPHIRFHDLRHTFATLALQNGVDVKTVSSMLGHYDAGFTLRTYTHATSRSRMKLHKRWAASWRK